MHITVRDDPRTGSRVFVAKGPPELVFRRVVGGLCWSGPQSRGPQCAVCVLGEERDEEFGTGQRHVRVLREAMAPTVEAALDLAAEYLEEYKAAPWVTPTDVPEQVRVQAWAKARERQRLPKLSIINPAAVDFQVLHNLALKRTATTKTLFFGDRSLAAAQYAGVRPDDFFRPVRVFPSVAACLYALSILDMREHSSVRISANRNVGAAEGGY